MTRIGLYDGISVGCLVLGGVTGLGAVWYALHASWLNTAVLAVTALLLWRLCSHFAQLAIAASGRQK